MPNKSLLIKASLFALILVLMVGSIVLYSSRQNHKNVLLIKEEIQRLYDSSIISAETVKNNKVLVVLSLQNPQSLNIKKEIEDKYPGKIIFQLKNLEVKSPIVTPEDEEASRRDPMFRYHLYEGCQLLQMGDIENYRKEVSVNTENKIEERISIRLKQFPTVIAIEKEIVEENDLVKISYRVFDGEKEYLNVGNQTVRCGKVNFDSQIEGSVKGKRVGEPYTINYYNNQWSSSTLQCEIIPLFCYYVEDAVANDEFARKNTQYQSMQEWRIALKDAILEEKKEELWEQIVTELIQSSTFTLNQDVLTQKAADLYLLTKLMANEFDMETDDLVEEMYHGSTEDFILYCYERSKMEIQEYLLVTAIATYASLSVSRQELEDDCGLNGITITQLEDNEIEDLSYLILRAKVKDYMINVMGN